MKPLLALFLFAAAFAASVLHAATGTVTFTPNNPPNTVEFYVEQKQADATWKEVAKGPASPISFTLSDAPGVYTYRVKARTSTLTSFPSNEFTGSLLPGAPTNASMIITTASIEIRKDGTVVALASASKP